MSVVGTQFAPLARRTFAEEIRERLAKSIALGELPPGSRLPPERDLCAAFGVARTSVREAVQGLISLGLVDRRGNGTYVVEHLPSISLNEADDRMARVRNLFEVRRVLEPPMAALAARRASDKERGEIAALAKQFVPGVPLAEFRRLDRTFHWSLARACGNELLAELYGKVLDALFQSKEFDDLLGSSDNTAAVREIIEAAGASHHKIADAIVSGEPADVVSAIDDHLQQVENQIINQLIEPPVPALSDSGGTDHEGS